MRDIDGSCKVWSLAAEPLDFVALSVCFLLSLLASLENEVQPRTAPTFCFLVDFHYFNFIHPRQAGQIS